MAFSNAEDDIALLWTDPSAAITRTSKSLLLLPRFSNLTEPSTFKVAEGVVVPIPILPVDPMIKRLCPSVFRVNGLPSKVPIKLAAESIPVFPFRDQFDVASERSAIFFQAPLLRNRKLLSEFR